MTETVQLIDTLFGNTRLFGYILNVLDIIRKMGFQYYFPHRTSHPGALHLTIKLPDEQSCPPPLAFFCKLRGTAPEPLRSRPKTHRRVPLANLFPTNLKDLPADFFCRLPIRSNLHISRRLLRFSISSSIYPTFIFPFSTGLSVLSFTRS